MASRTRRAIWDGKVPVVFNLAQNEITSMDSPLPYMMLIPRMTFLPLVSKGVREHFFAYACEREDELWFDCNGMPVKWEIPMGVLYDLLNDKKPTPLHLTVHFLGFPTTQLLRCPNSFTVRSVFTNTLKEACYLQFGNPAVANSLNQNEHEELWQSVQNADQRLYEDVMERIDTSAQAKKTFRYPIRVLMNGFNQQYDHDMRFICRPVNHLQAPQEQTMLSALNLIIPGVVCDVATDQRKPGVQVFVQGVQPSLDTQVEWLWKLFHHPDRFMYISIVRSSS